MNGFKNKLTMKTSYFLLNSLFVLLLFACSSEDKNADQASKTPKATSLQLSKKQIKALGIELGTLDQKQIGLSVYANGIIDVPPQNKSYVAIPFGAYIKKINVLDGMLVQKGQILMVVEHPEVIQFQQEFLELQGQQ